MRLLHYINEELCIYFSRIFTSEITRIKNPLREYFPFDILFSLSPIFSEVDRYHCAIHRISTKEFLFHSTSFIKTFSKTNNSKLVPIEAGSLKQNKTIWLLGT